MASNRNNLLLRLTAVTVVILQLSSSQFYGNCVGLVAAQRVFNNSTIGQRPLNDECSKRDHLPQAVSENKTTPVASNSKLIDSLDGQQSQETIVNLEKVTKSSLDKDIYTKKRLGASEKYFYHMEDLHEKHTIADLGWMALTTKMQCSVYSDIYMHRYDDFNELKVSGGPEADNELCLRQLEHLNERAILLAKEGFFSKDVNLYQLLDSYGRVPPGMLVGHASWIGVYSECLKTQIQFPEGKSSTRYCWAHMRHPSWPTNELMSQVGFLKSGVCLPKACDSTNYKNKYDLVLKLLAFHMRDVDTDQGNLTSLYCLPDDQSPIRSWWQHPKTLLTVTAIGSWCLFLIFCTIKSEQAERREQVEKEEEKNCSKMIDSTMPNAPGKVLSLSGGKVERSDASGNEPIKEKQVLRSDTTRLVIYRSLSITNNLRLLFNTTKQSSLLEAGDKLKGGEPQQAGATATAADAAAADACDMTRAIKIVDLSCVEGIKVICMCYVIMGHVLMCCIASITNGRETGMSSSPMLSIANLVPAFAVNSFFTITGVLTSYLMFKQNKSHSFITSPIKWVAFILYRYLRIMPMYLIVILYTKHLARYTGSGPQWDYGTSAISQRKACENESWLWTVLFGANFKSPLDHCIPSAWYLANDFQFFIITPIFLALLERSANFGTKVIKACIVAGFIGGFLSVYLSDVEDLTPVARFMPHGFKTYVTHLSANYTRPQYRLPAYLCGLLIGFVLYQFEQDKLKYLAAKREAAERRQQQLERGEPVHTSNEEEEEQLIEPDWSDSFKKHGVFHCVHCIWACCITPFVGSRIPFTKSSARFVVSLIMPSYHLMFSLAVGLYILLATTGYGNKHLNGLLSMPAWKPFARLSLCAVLINVEVINYIIQTKNTFQYFDNQYLFSLNIICIMSTYLAAIVMCVLFEAPVRAALNHLLSYAISKAAPPKQKTA